MVIIFLAPVLMGVGRARCAGAGFYATAALTTIPFAVIPVAAGSLVTLLLVNTFPARRARDILMLMGLLFAASIVVLLRFIRPEQLMRVESLPDLTDFFATLQSPVTPMLPSFWAGETIFAGLRGQPDWLHFAALWLSVGMAGFVMATVAVRFVFPAVSAEGASFWIIRTSPISLGDFLWSKFWTGLVPVLLLTEVLTVAGNELLGVDPFLKAMAAIAIVF